MEKQKLHTILCVLKCKISGEGNDFQAYLGLKLIFDQDSLYNM